MTASVALKFSRQRSEAVADRPLGLRARPDLIIVPQVHGRDRYWLVKDPAALKYFHLREEEHALLALLDGRTSLAEVKRRFEAQFAPLRASVEQIHAFLGRLNDLGLLLVETPGQGRQLIERRAARMRRTWFAAVTNLLAIRCPGIDPTRQLQSLYPFCRWIFSSWTLAFVGACIAAAIVLVLGQFVVFRARLPDLHAFLTLSNAFWLAVALAGVKVVHELGHALTCKHFGGECREVGVLLLVFTPCLYCNVSDAWLFGDKWQRIAVSAAGIVVELFLASVATFLWWFSMPGLLHTLCLNVMLICSLSTLLFNGNPLLRYDGYYVLADFLDVPNLGQQSRWFLGRTLSSLFLGTDSPPDRAVPRNRRAALLIYGVASVVYGWIVLIGVLWLCHRALEPRGLKVLAQLLTWIVIPGAIAVPALGFAKTMLSPPRSPRVRPGRAIFSFGILTALLTGLLLTPLPFSIHAPAVVQPSDAQRVYVVVPGRIEWSVSPGDAVAEGQELALLANLDVHKETAELAGQVEQQRLQLANLRLRHGSDASVAAQIPGAEAALADTLGRLRQRQKDEERLVLRAPMAGTVLPPPRIAPRSPSAGQLAAWQGSPLDARNRGCHLETGALLCQIGTPGKLEAVLVIDQADVNYVRKDQQVRLVIDEQPGQILHGTIIEVATMDLKIAPRELTTGTDLAVRLDEKGQPHPQTTVYQALVHLDEPDEKLLPGTRGQAKITAAPQSIGQRLYRYIKQTF